ncbi:Alkaline phosphatase synthesis sensor protein phoR [uncultured Clostridium sp.]|uniref:histidine kinase n=1 Tax=Muricoprocola aceti TaxID=2981772 RepID=A0ABT2SL86_9FIRM|nr:HAMP domain-containing sensor histidine kinase [Muricoprocola aceti]MCI7226467.1 HAMP domain-containing histidine kinase [Lachnospiraceae bacterium]SCH45133.1 Alkaline phosphatase synthesis sensor protein phoR [uncultured Clostridium sp.]MCU6725272.1 HAMP domain-containing histidine kinase [Muricoprocola aceti]MDD7435610.1 HAMP domain-containing sensor histidine kinase [Lachnospiraceae bacterium]MDY3342636.1 HAMP domain-containing sensor histidine kinase [Lachnospiraceae bacterium]
MKSNYKKLKRTILIRTGLVALLALVIGEGIVHFFIDGIFQGLFTRAMMAIFTGMHMDSEMANEWYGRIFMDHKTVFLVIGFIILFLIFYNLLVKRMLHYLSSVEAAIDAIQREDDEQIVLVPELKPLEDKLMALRATLKRKEMETAISEQKKNDLVVYLAHDLKTPLTSIIAYLTMLDQRKSMPDEDREKYIHVTFEKASRLRELINEFFEITRFNLQDIVLEKEQLNLSFLLEQLADESYGVLKDKYLTCSVKTDDDLMVMGDPDKLARVFDNLLRNAIAYSYTDTEIEIEARAKGTDIVITFENQGHEIPEQNLKLIFEKFYRVDNARSSQTGGSGLGLSIAKRIVELHGGIIEATSDWERTTFTVVLPGIHNPTQKVEIQEKEEEDPLSRHQKLGTNKKSEIGKKNRRRV